jgi:PAS domain S-box-containing protein
MRSSAYSVPSMVNLTKILPWLSIRNKLLIAFAGLSVLPVAMIGVYDIVSSVRSAKEIAFSELKRDVVLIRGEVGNFLTNVETDLHLIKNSSSFQRYVNTLDQTPSREAFQRACDEILSFMHTKGIYYQIRLVDHNGDELLRIGATNPNDTIRTYRVARNAELRSSNEPYYFLLTGNVDPGHVTYAPAELVGPANQRVPVITFAMPFVSRAGRTRILIANVFTQDFFSVLEPRPNEVAGHVVLVSSDGFYLYHSQRKSEWNRLLAAREEDNLSREYPADVIMKLFSGDEGILDAGNEIISYAPLFTAHSDERGRHGTPRLSIPLYVLESVPQSVILGPTYSLVWVFAGLLGVFLVGAIGLGLLATREFTGPIGEMQRGAEIIANGNYGHRLRIETRDEIEQLAQQFNQMAVSLEAHEQEIQRHRTTLEKTVERRTRELIGEKAKLQAIVDNVPSAFVLLDRRFHIQSASAAFVDITGRHFDDVRGSSCRNVFCDGGSCSACLCQRALTSGSTESHIDTVTADEGNQRFIEHVVIPMKENGDVTSILAIITDVTQRKRLEQNLIQTERLMAAGEMSAIIAHEFRNALTSIKMILQLQSESQRLNRSDRRSLSVALRSLYHMENVVTELLNFGRPSHMEFGSHDIKAVIDESLSFVQAQMRASRIRSEKTIDESLSDMRLDPSRLREALVNILLNAIQAIRAEEKSAPQQVIRVTARRVPVRKTLRDFGIMPEGTSPGQSEDQKEHDIILWKGTECVVVEISDTGPGMDKRTLGRVFDPFFTTKTNGTGLGLPMVKRTINAHRGIVTVSSRKGKGTTFSIFLPLWNGSVQ